MAYNKKLQPPSWIGSLAKDIIYAGSKSPGILQEHKGAVMLLMRQCKNWDEFYGRMEEYYPIVTPQLRFDFMEDKSVSDEVHPTLF